MRRTLTLGGLAGINVLVSFAFQWYIFTHLGPGRATDALVAGMVVPQLVFAVVSGSLTHVLVPLLASEDESTFRRDAWTFFQGVGLFFGAVALVLSLAAPIWVPLTVPGFGGPTTALTVALVRVQLIGMVFTASTSVLWSVYHARQRFAWAELSVVLAAVLSFPVLLLALPRYGVLAAAWVFVLKFGLQMLMLLPGLGRYHRPDFGTAAAKEAWRRIHPLLVGTSFYKTDQLVDRFLASMAPAGGISLLYLAQQLYGAGHQVLNTAVAAPMVPALAMRATRRDWSGFRQLSRKRLHLMLAVTGVCLIGLVAVGGPVLSALFGHGRFDAREIDRLWWLLLALGGTWVGGAAGQILSTSFYAKGDTRTPTRIGVLGFAAGVVFKVGGFYLFGVVGIALGTSLYFMINAVALYLFLSRDAELPPVTGTDNVGVVYERA